MMTESEEYRKLDYTHQKLMEAVQFMATSAEPLERRLKGAMTAVKRLTGEDFPSPALRDEWFTVIEPFTREDALGDERKHYAIISKMSANEQGKTAESIFSLFYHVANERSDIREGVR